LDLLQSESEGRGYSERFAEAIDVEIRGLIDAGMGQAELILSRHRDVLDALAARLLEDETIEGEELEMLFQGDGQSAGVVTPLPRYRHRPGAPNLLPLPRVAPSLASTTLPEPTPES